VGPSTRVTTPVDGFHTSPTPPRCTCTRGALSRHLPETEGQLIKLQANQIFSCVAEIPKYPRNTCGQVLHLSGRQN